MRSSFGVVDLFAGPGGLGEGFASLSDADQRPFRIRFSVEKEASAHSTLRLRAFLREYVARHGSLPKQYIMFHAGATPEPDWSAVDSEAWRRASEEARALELGTPAAATEMSSAIHRMRSGHDDTILIGGPPCQAYSLVGRARSKANVGYVPEKDARHFLFREYLSVLDRVRPAVFVMENVKGMLSSSVSGRLIFDMLMEDLSSLGIRGGHYYELRAIRVFDGQASLQVPTSPSDFVVRAEQFGVPQKRHRVIIVGIRSDLAHRFTRARIPVSRRERTVRHTLANMPRIRSGISKGRDDAETWLNEVSNAAQILADMCAERDVALTKAFQEVRKSLVHAAPRSRSAFQLPHGYGASNDELLQWLENPSLQAVAQHETRGHMTPDLRRYLFVSVFGAVHGYSPKAGDFPKELSPDHRNWHTGVFNDRFRVQLEQEPATTITSHISKDGHYFIHYDPVQCRSLTVREAARLQTFPDDYLFLGNRTQQYVQIGNAVPPFLARQIAKLIYAGLSES